MALKIASDSCSGVTQREQSRFRPDLLSASIKGSPEVLGSCCFDHLWAVQRHPGKDEPATESPYAIWRDGNSLPRRHEDRVASQCLPRRSGGPVKPARQPGSPAVGDPWLLVRPGARERSRLFVPTLPASTYPNWTGANQFDRARVLFDGVPFEAKWWNQAESRGSILLTPTSSPWGAADADPDLEGRRGCRSTVKSSRQAGGTGSYGLSRNGFVASTGGRRA
jgi:chitinase